MKGQSKMTNKEFNSCLELLKAYIESAADKESILKVIERMQEKLK